VRAKLETTKKSLDGPLVDSSDQNKNQKKKRKKKNHQRCGGRLVLQLAGKPLQKGTTLRREGA